MITGQLCSLQTRNPVQHDGDREREETRSEDLQHAAGAEHGETLPVDRVDHRLDLHQGRRRVRDARLVVPVLDEGVHIHQ